MIRRWRGRLQQAAQRPGRVLILLYHRVAKSFSDPWANVVTPRRFAEHLEVLRQHAHPIGLQQLSRALLGGNLPDRSVVVTFDDGYVDNLYKAKPLLERYGIPATVFVITGYIGSNREFWWDELDRLFLQPGALPERLSLNVNGSTYRWELGEAAHYSEEDFRRHRKWRAQREPPTSRHYLCRSIWELLKPQSQGERQRVLDELLAWAGAEEKVRPSHRPLSLEEVAALGKGGLIEVGAHTVTHSTLSALPVVSQREEILGSKAQLEAILGRPVENFSYPYGGSSDYTAETTSMVREAGFSCACSVFIDAVRVFADPFQLPRIPVPNCNGEKFAERLSKWFDD